MDSKHSLLKMTITALDCSADADLCNLTSPSRNQRQEGAPFLSTQNGIKRSWFFARFTVRTHCTPSSNVQLCWGSLQHSWTVSSLHCHKNVTHTTLALKQEAKTALKKRTSDMCFIYICYSPHYSGRENKRTRNTTKQKNKQYKSTRTDQTLDIMQFIAVHSIIFPNEVLFTLFKLFTG